jgi:hypothetical protein
MMNPSLAEKDRLRSGGDAAENGRKTGLAKANSDTVFGQGKNDRKTDCLISKNRPPRALIRSALKRRAMPDDDEHDVYAIALP